MINLLIYPSTASTTQKTPDQTALVYFYFFHKRPPTVSFE